MYALAAAHDDVLAESFGHDAANFQNLLGLMAKISISLWLLVLVTAVIRFVAVRLYRRPVPRTLGIQDLVGGEAEDRNVVAPLDRAPAEAANVVATVPDPRAPARPVLAVGEHAVARLVTARPERVEA